MVRPTFLGALFSGWQNDFWRGSEFGPCYVQHISLVQRAVITVPAVVPEMWLMVMKRKLSKERKKAGGCFGKGGNHLTFDRCFQNLSLRIPWFSLKHVHYFLLFVLPGCDSALLEASVMVREKLQALRSKTETWMRNSTDCLVQDVGICHSVCQIPLWTDDVRCLFGDSNLSEGPPVLPRNIFTTTRNWSVVLNQLLLAVAKVVWMSTSFGFSCLCQVCSMAWQLKTLCLYVPFRSESDSYALNMCICQDVPKYIIGYRIM